MKIFLLLLLPLEALAQANPPPKVTLAWNASPSTGITNYAVYFGPASGLYTNSINAGLALTVAVTNVSRGQTYFFAATAKDNRGLESDFSNEVSTSIPAVPPPPANLKIVVGP